MSKLTHLDEDGAAHMVDVSDKQVTRRSATAEGRIVMTTEALAAITQGDLPKGDAIAAARIAGIMAAKKTGELIPLCHPLGLEAVSIEFHLEDDAIRVVATASLNGKTGVEMEALTAVTTACLTVYDMVKAVEKSMVIEDIRLILKDGGKSGRYEADR